MLALDRVIADLLCILPWRGRAPDALAVLDQALRRAGDDHETFRKAVAARLDQRPDIRGTVRARGLLDLGSERAESPPESWVRLILIEHGFPLPEVNWVITTPDGRELARLDLAWPGCASAWSTTDGRPTPVAKPRTPPAQQQLRRHGWIVMRVAVGDALSIRGAAQRPARGVRQARLRVGSDRDGGEAGDASSPCEDELACSGGCAGPAT